jgi:hypothetical protein
MHSNEPDRAMLVDAICIAAGVINRRHHHHSQHHEYNLSESSIKDFAPLGMSLSPWHNQQYNTVRHHIIGRVDDNT